MENDLFELDEIMGDTLTLKKPVRLIELFAGIGSQAMALRDIGANFESWRVVEFDKYAVQSYNAIHGTQYTTQDITQIHAADLAIENVELYDYIMTYSFPCQDLSVAGKQAGMTKDSGTRSGLLWEVERILNECDELPQVLLMENVTQVHGKKNAADFAKWCAFLESKGYKNYWQDMNAKDYGVAQNRNRCFMVSTLYNEPYNFPQPVELTKCIRDYLENNVDNKYYLNDDREFKINEKILNINEIQDRTCIDHSMLGLDGNVRVYKNTFPAILAREYKDPRLIIVGGYQKKQAIKKRRHLYNLTAEMGGGGGYTPMILDNKRCLQVGSVNIGNNESNNRVYSPDYCSPTLNTMQGGHRQPKILMSYRIRKITPRECWRLMSFSDLDFDKAAAVCSNTQLYKQAGNSIVVECLKAIFSKMFA